MSYTTPLKVFQSMERIETAEEEFDDVESGDTLTLSNEYIVKDAYPDKDKTLILIVDGTEQDSEDYDIDFETQEIDYDGSDSGDATVEYKHAPYSSSIVEQRIEGVEEYIDDYTNSTYDGLKSVEDELYDGRGRQQDTYVFARRPVRSVSKVELNKPNQGDGNPNYVEVDEGLGNDYTTYKKLGIRFNEDGDNPSKRRRDLQVSYEYGYEDVPSDLEVAATEMVVDDLVRGTVSGAMVDGRDNFDPQTVDVNVRAYQEVLDRYRIQRMSSLVNLAEKGEIS